MYEKFTNYFVCPQCHAPLVLLKLFSKNSEEILDGIFGCERSHYYPIIDGIPRLLEIKSLLEFVDNSRLNIFINMYFKDIPVIFVDNIRKQKDACKSVDVNTAGFYADMWRRYDTDFDVYDDREFRRLTGNYLPFKSLKNMSVIDVGSGGGRYVKPLLLAGVEEIICMDLGDAITLAYRKYRHEKRVLCIQADIHRLPFENYFDFVLCIGVLQHLQDSSSGFAQLVKLVNQRGQVFVWVYGNSSIKNILIVLRKACRKLSWAWLWNLSGFFAALRWAASKLPVWLPMFGGYNEGYSFHYFRTNTFDHLSTPIINFFYRDTLVEWLQKANIIKYELIERFPRQANASWIIKAKKCIEISVLLLIAFLGKYYVYCTT